jgi:hypothetical protein
VSTCDYNGIRHELVWPKVKVENAIPINRRRRRESGPTILGTIWLPMNIYRPGDTILGYSLLR